MDLIIAGRLRSAMPGLVDGIRKASETSTGSKVLLSRVRDAAPPTEMLARLGSGGMAVAGSLRPPPAPAIPTAARVHPERTGSVAATVRAFAEDTRVQGDPGRARSLGRLGRAVDLLDSTVREQQDLLRRGLRDLR